MGEQKELEVLASPPHEEMEVYHGIAAYEFLLLVSSGLKSEILGETDIFGQVKRAWIEFEKETSNSNRRFLSPIFQKIFSDTKKIRSEYLEGLGGNSYGTLVRKLLELDPNQDSILVLGAGQIAHSILPYLLDFKIWLWNRTLEKAAALKKSLLNQTRLDTNIFLTKTPEQEAQAWSEATQVILCVPPDANIHHHPFCPVFNNKAILHLGCTEGELGKWEVQIREKMEKFYTLDDLFQLQKNLTQARSIKIQKARQACEEIAKSRDRFLEYKNLNPISAVN